MTQDVRPPLPRPPSPITLPHLLRPDDTGADEDSQEDIFASALALLDPLATSNQHGDPGNVMMYNGRDRAPLLLQLSDPGKEDERQLFAHYVWNAGLLLAECIGQGWWWDRLPPKSWTRQASWSVHGLDVLELGSGTGLVGMCSKLAGARRVTVTDFPGPSILAALQHNLAINVSSEAKQQINAQGHEWGVFDAWARNEGGSYDIVLAADTLWIKSAHAAQARSMAHFLRDSPTAAVWIIAGFHTGRPKVRQFLENELPRVGLVVEHSWEVDVEGKERVWEGQREEGFGEGARWCVMARIRWEKYLQPSTESS